MVIQEALRKHIFIIYKQMNRRKRRKKKKEKKRRREKREKRTIRINHTSINSDIIYQTSVPPQARPLIAQNI